MEKLCVIFGAGDVFPPRKKLPSALVIAADGGYEKAMNAGYAPDVVIGDFDSSNEPKDTDAFIIKLNRDKDDTDMIAAVKTGLRRGCKTFAIFGGTGGRLDHTVANFATLCYLNTFGARGFLVDNNSVATVITDGKFTLPKSCRGTVSVFAYGGKAEGVTYKNLKFPLENADLTPEFPLGVSNEIIASPATVSVKSGSLLIFFPRSH